MKQRILMLLVLVAAMILSVTACTSAAADKKEGVSAGSSDYETSDTADETASAGTGIPEDSSQIISSEAPGTVIVSSEAAGSGILSSRTASSGTLSSKTASSRAISSRAVSSSVVNPKTVDSKAARSEAASSKDMSNVEVSSAAAVSSEAASVPNYSINMRNSIPEGIQIPFTTGININIHASDDESRFNMLIAESFLQLKEIFDQDSNLNQIDYIDKYDEAFFENHAVILLFIVNGSGSIKHKVDSITKNNNELCIAYTTFVAGPDQVMTCDMAYWRILIEVKQSDLSGITTLSYYNQTAFY